MSFVDEYSKYLQWQSTIEILTGTSYLFFRLFTLLHLANPSSDPPVGSLSSTVDLVGGMATIRARAAANLYNSQYDFDQAIYKLIHSANDGHLEIIPCSFAITFRINTPLVSLSTDGITVPKLYTLSASIAFSQNGTLYLTDFGS